jgi:hypothetical protein
VVVTLRASMLIATLIAGVWAGPVAADGDDRARGDPGDRRNGLEFGIDESFSVKEQLGASVSWKRYDGHDGAWRVGLTPTLQGDREQSPGSSLRTSGLAIALEIQRLWYLAGRSEARPFWGFGPLLSHSRSKSIDRNSDYAEFDQERRSLARRYRAGLQAVVGAEFRIAGRIVLGAEYGLQVAWVREKYVHEYHEPASSQQSTHTGTTYHLTSRPATLTLAILF